MQAVKTSRQFWTQFTENIWKKETFAIKNSFISPPIAADELFYIITNDFHVTKNSLTSQRFYIEGKNQQLKGSDYYPKPEDRTFLDYSQRISSICENREYILIIDNIVANYSLWDWTYNFLRDLYSSLGYLNYGHFWSIFYGNYSRTPFGVHDHNYPGDPAESSFYFPIEGKKSMRIWTPEFVKRNKSIKGSTQCIGNHLHLSTKINDLISSLTIFERLPLNYWFTWVIGAYLAENILSKNKRGLNFNLKHHLLLLGLFIIGHEYIPFDIVGNFAITFLLASLIEIYIINRKNIGFIENIIAQIGLCSYSIYLLSEPFLLWAELWIKKLFKLLFNSNFQYLEHPYFMCTFGALIIFIPIFIISWFSYKYIEIPTHRLGRRLAQDRVFLNLVKNVIIKD